MIFSAIVSFGNGILNTFIGMYIIETTKSYLMFALTVILPNVMTISSKLWGILSDYYGSRKNFIIIGAFSSSIIWLPLTFFLTPQGLVIISSLGSALWSIGEPAFYAALIGEGSDKGKRMGLNNMAGVGMLTLGSLISGYLYNILGGKFLVGFSALLFIVATLYVALSYREIIRHRISDKSFMEYLRESFSFTLIKEPQLRVINMSIIIADIASSSAYPILWGLYYEKINYNRELYGIANAIVVGVASIVSPGLGYLVDRIGGYLSYILSQAGAVPILWIYGSIENPLFMVILLMIPLGLLKYVALYKLYTDICKEKAGDAIGTVNTMSRIACLPGVYIASLADIFGESLTLELLALIKIVSVLTALTCLRYRKSGENADIS